MSMTHWMMFWVTAVTGFASDWPPEVWTRPTEPFHIVGPVYYVGGRELTAYLVADEEGLVLVNVGMAANVPMVLESIATLGFDPEEIRFLLVTQAHMDHAGGAALLRERTGAEVLAGRADVPLLEAGGLGDYVFGDEAPYAPVADARGLRHEEVIVCGKLRLRTVATPGHTPGGSSWLLETEQDGQAIRVLFQGSISVLPDAVLTDNASYPNAIADFRTSFRRLEACRADFVLPDHMVFAHPDGITHQAEPDPAWFRRPEILVDQIARSRRAIERYLAKGTSR